MVIIIDKTNYSAPQPTKISLSYTPPCLRLPEKSLGGQKSEIAVRKHSIKGRSRSTRIRQGKFTREISPIRQKKIYTFPAPDSS